MDDVPYILREYLFKYKTELVRMTLEHLLEEADRQRVKFQSVSAALKYYNLIEDNEVLLRGIKFNKDDVIPLDTRGYHPVNSSSSASGSGVQSSILPQRLDKQTSAPVSGSVVNDDVDRQPPVTAFGASVEGKKVDGLPLEMICKVCMDHILEVVFLGCTHAVTCHSCGVSLTHCPVCRKEIRGFAHLRF